MINLEQERSEKGIILIESFLNALLLVIDLLEFIAETSEFKGLLNYAVLVSDLCLHGVWESIIAFYDICLQFILLICKVDSKAALYGRHGLLKIPYVLLHAS